MALPPRPSPPSEVEREKHNIFGMRRSISRDPVVIPECRHIPASNPLPMHIPFPESLPRSVQFPSPVFILLSRSFSAVRPTPRIRLV